MQQWKKRDSFQSILVWRESSFNLLCVDLNDHLHFKKINKFQLDVLNECWASEVPPSAIRVSYMCTFCEQQLNWAF